MLMILTMLMTLTIPRLRLHAARPVCRYLPRSRYSRCSPLVPGGGSEEAGALHASAAASRSVDVQRRQDLHRLGGPRPDQPRPRRGAAGGAAAQGDRGHGGGRAVHVVAQACGEDGVAGAPAWSEPPSRQRQSRPPPPPTPHPPPTSARLAPLGSGAERRAALPRPSVPPRNRFEPRPKTPRTPTPPGCGCPGARRDGAHMDARVPHVAAQRAQLRPAAGPGQGELRRGARAAAGAAVAARLHRQASAVE